MNKRLTKPREKNERLESPFGLLGVPPDFNLSPLGPIARGATVIIVNGDATIIKRGGRKEPTQ